jgi:hypothetical protein
MQQRASHAHVCMPMSILTLPPPPNFFSPTCHAIMPSRPCHSHHLGSTCTTSPSFLPTYPPFALVVLPISTFLPVFVTCFFWGKNLYMWLLSSDASFVPILVFFMQEWWRTTGVTVTTTAAASSMTPSAHKSSEAVVISITKAKKDPIFNPIFVDASL